MDPDMKMRVVPLRADEAAEIMRQSMNRAGTACCPHMSIFHWSVERPDGTHIRACNINGCDCYDETPPDSSRRRMDAEDVMIARWERRRAFLTGCAMGVAALAAAVGAWVL